MSLFARTNEKSSREEDYPRQIGMGTVTAARYGGGGMGVGNSMPVSPKSQVEMDKKMRREVANSNERRRMQSINAGFQSLRNLLPRHENEKLSKAAILQHTAEYIYQLEQEKTRLLSQNCQLKRVIHHQQLQDGESPESPRPPKRKKQDLDAAVCPESDEGFGNMSPEQQEDQSNEELRKEMIDLRVQLDRERRLRVMMEDQTRSLRQQIYPEPRREISSRMTYQSGYGADAYLKAEIVDEVPRRRPQMMDKQTDPLDVEPLVKDDLTEDMACLAEVTLEEATIQTREMLPDRIPVMIEAAMDPKMDVEVAPRVPSPAAHTAITADGQTINHPTKGRIYVAKTSRQNLETIVEAIRHLEGDHLFSDEKVKRDPSPLHDDDHIQEVPLELTTSVRNTNDSVPSLPLTSSSTFSHPGVIVFKNAPSSL